jgi:hypothetical protein
VVESIRYVMWGLLQVEDEIIKQVLARHVPLSRADFSWNGGYSLFNGALEESIPMEVRAGGRHVATQWPRKHLEDSRDRVKRQEVRQRIDWIVETLAPHTR